MRTFVKLAIASLLVLAVSCGESGGPTSPADMPTSGGVATTGTRSAQTGAWSGRIFNAVTGEPVARARIVVEGAGVVTSRGDGTFTLPLSSATATPLPALIESEAFWPRRSHVSSALTKFVEIGLFPEAEPFDLDFFDYIFRRAGERGTRIWGQEPLFEIWTKVFDCVDMAQSGVCNELQATAQNVPTRFRQITEQTILDHARRYTGGTILGTNITELAHPVGTRIPHAQQSAIGKITFAMVQFPHNTSWARSWFFTQSGKLSRAHIQMNKKHKDASGVYSHELAHTLGFSHPTGSENVPLASIMRSGHGPEPTRHDVLHGRLLYSRPANSMTPDQDPADFLINALREASIGSGPEMEIVEQ